MFRSGALPSLVKSNCTPSFTRSSMWFRFFRLAFCLSDSVSKRALATSEADFPSITMALVVNSSEVPRVSATSVNAKVVVFVYLGFLFYAV